MEAHVLNWLFLLGLLKLANEVQTRDNTEHIQVVVTVQLTVTRLQYCSI